MKGKISFLLGCAGLITCIFLETGELKSTIFKIGLGFVIGGIIEFAAFLIESRKKWNVLKTMVYKRNQKVRVTVAYLFRVEVNGHYVLIKRHKKDRPGYQPIGGAFKYLREETRECFEKLGIEPCNHVERDEDTDNDLRIIINKRKNLNSFLKWFESRKGREIDPWREFYEEMIEPGLLPIEAFKHIKYVFIRKHEEGIVKSPVFAVDEYRYAEIYELRPETDEQKKAIQALRNIDESILFATPDEIRRGSSNDGKVILPHTFKILPK